MKYKKSSAAIKGKGNSVMSVLLCRLDYLGFCSSLINHPSLGRRSNVLIVSICALVLTALTALALNTETVNAATITLNVAGTVSADVMPTYGTGTTTTSPDDSAVISVKTNNVTGYKLSIAASDTVSGNTAGLNVPLISADASCVGVCTIPSIATNTEYSDVASFGINTWGYMLSKRNNSTDEWNNMYDYYQPAPTTAGNDIETTGTANDADFNDYNISIAARVGSDMSPSTYQNVFVVTAVANPLSYNVVYTNKVGVTGVSGMPQNVTDAIAGDGENTITLDNALPTRTGYTFNKWCTVEPTTTGGVDTCSGTEYVSGATYTLDTTINPNDVTLYAMWTINSYSVTVNFAGTGVGSVAFENSTYGNATSVSTSGGTTSLKYGVPYTITMMPISNSYTLDTWATTANGALGSTTVTPTTYTVTGTATLTVTGKTDRAYMQDQTVSTLAALMPNIGDTTTLYDKRDNKPYLVGRLKMNSAGTTSAYWMLENLALDLTDAGVRSVMYDSGDANHNTLTNADNTTLGYLFNGGGTTSDQYPTAKLNNVAWTSSSQNYYSIPMMASSGTCNNAYCVNSPSSGNWSYGATTTATINGTTSVAQGKIGIYYNYCATSAGSYCYGNGTSSTGSPSSDPDTSTLRDVKKDICPKGWRLPTSTSSGEFQTLYAAYGSNSTNFQTALSTPLSGRFYSGKAYYQGYGGYFWSSTWNYTIYVYSLYVSSSNVNPSDFNNRNDGRSVRCILAE